MKAVLNQLQKSLKNTATVLADRDTQGVTGAPDIVQTIFSKVDECDVFVADVTSVALYHPIRTSWFRLPFSAESGRSFSSPPLLILPFFPANDIIKKRSIVK